jgi:hypothetical protein
MEAPDLENEDGIMPKEQSPGEPTTRRYSEEEKAAAVRMVRTLRTELGNDGTVKRVAASPAGSVIDCDVTVRHVSLG